MNNNIKPVNGDPYLWVRSDTGGICKAEWIDGVPSHEFRWSIGNVFRSRADAKLAIATQQNRMEDARRAQE